MECYVVNGQGLDQLRRESRADLPPPPAGHVHVAVHAVSLNYRDLLVATGGYGGAQDPPIIAASDMSGVVSAVGPDVRSLSEGDRVVNAPFRHWPAGKLHSDWARTFVGGQGLDGVLAETVCYPADALVPCPAPFSFEEAATLTVAGLTAWSAVVTHGKTVPGEWVLLHGTGGVSIYAAQLAQALGARVILTTSNQDKAQRAVEEFGVAATLDYRQPDWPRQARKITGGAGADVVVEVAGGETLQKSLEACNFGGRVALIGVLGGVTSQINLFTLISRQITVRGVYMESTAELRKLVAACEVGLLRPVVDKVFPFAEAAEAYRHLQSQQHFGKVVIRVAK